jgi:hypothetical protein
MWLSFLLAIVITWLDWDQIMSKAQEAGGGSLAAEGVQVAAIVKTLTIVSMVIGFAVMVLLIILIARMRQNWARWVFAVLFVLGLPFTLINLPAVLSANPTAGALSVVQMVLQVTALVLIFVPSARPWFSKRVDARTQQA